MNQIKIGAFLSYTSIILTIFIAFLYTPMMIRLLGQSEYGLYAMIGSITAYLSIMDLGLGSAMVRYIARNRAIGGEESASRLNGLFLLLYSLIGVLTIVIGFYLLQRVDNIFGNGLNTSELDKAKIMIIILTINFSFSFPLSIFSSIMQAHERFVNLKVVGIIRSLIIPLCSLPFLIMGYGSIMLVVISVSINLLCLIYNVYYCLKYFKIKFKFGKMDYPLLKEVLGYSFFIFLGILVDQINWNSGQIILGAVSGTAAVAVFAIAIQFVKIYLQFSTSISGLFLPRITMMVANNASTNELSFMMIKFGRIQYLILAFILSGFFLFGYPFISVWAGPGYVDAYYMVLIIMIPITVPLIQNIGLSILQAKNLQGFRSIVLIIVAILNVIISIPLSQYIGGTGAAIGTGISYMIGNTIIMNLYYYYKIGINIPLFWKNIFSISIPVILSLLLGYGINIFIQSNNLILILLKIVLFSVAYVVFNWIFALNQYEKNIFISVLNKIKSFFIKNKIRTEQPY